MVTRGRALSHPAVVAALAPFVVCQSFGNDRDTPAEFRDCIPDGYHNETTFFLVFDSRGEFVHAFPGVSRSGGMIGSEEYVLGEIEDVRRMLGLVEESDGAGRPIRLPDLAPVADPAEAAGRLPAGVRVVVRNLDRDPTKLGAESPVFELVEMDPEEWGSFAYGEAERAIPASAIQPWISVAYPPAKFEMVGSASFPNEVTAGSLVWRPAGSDGDKRYAVATADLSIELDGIEHVEYGGRIKIVFTYDLDSPEVRSAKGVILGKYPSYDVGNGSTHELRFAALFESRP